MYVGSDCFTGVYVISKSTVLVRQVLQPSQQLPQGVQVFPKADCFPGEAVPVHETKQERLDLQNLGQTSVIPRLHHPAELVHLHYLPCSPAKTHGEQVGAVPSTLPGEDVGANN